MQVQQDMENLACLRKQVEQATAVFERTKKQVVDIWAREVEVLDEVRAGNKGFKMTVVKG